MHLYCFFGLAMLLARILVVLHEQKKETMKKVIFTLGTLAISVGLFAQIAPISDVKKP
jgi:uncharacterized membrane protein